MRATQQMTSTACRTCSASDEATRCVPRFRVLAVEHHLAQPGRVRGQALDQPVARRQAALVHALQQLRARESKGREHTSHPTESTPAARAHRVSHFRAGNQADEALTQVKRRKNSRRAKQKRTAIQSLMFLFFLARARVSNTKNVQACVHMTPRSELGTCRHVQITQRDSGSESGLIKRRLRNWKPHHGQDALSKGAMGQSTHSITAETIPHLSVLGVGLIRGHPFDLPAHHFPHEGEVARVEHVLVAQQLQIRAPNLCNERVSNQRSAVSWLRHS